MLSSDSNSGQLTPAAIVLFSDCSCLYSCAAQGGGNTLVLAFNYTAQNKLLVSIGFAGKQLCSMDLEKTGSNVFINKMRKAQKPL